MTTLKVNTSILTPRQIKTSRTKITHKVYFLANWKYRIHTMLNINKTILFDPKKNSLEYLKTKHMVFQELQWWFNFKSIIWNISEFPHNDHSLNNINQNQFCNNIAFKTKVSLSKYATKRKQVMFFLRESKDPKASNWNWHCLGTGWRPFFFILGVLLFFPAVLSNSNFWKTEGYVLKPASI